MTNEGTSPHIHISRPAVFYRSSDFNINWDVTDSGNSCSSTWLWLLSHAHTVTWRWLAGQTRHGACEEEEESETFNFSLLRFSCSFFGGGVTKYGATQESPNPREAFNFFYCCFRRTQSGLMSFYTSQTHDMLTACRPPLRLQHMTVTQRCTQHRTIQIIHSCDQWMWQRPSSESIRITQAASQHTHTHTHCCCLTDSCSLASVHPQRAVSQTEGPVSQGPTHTQWIKDQKKKTYFSSKTWINGVIHFLHWGSRSLWRRD